MIETVDFKKCPACKEKNNPAFAACWRCHHSFEKAKETNSSSEPILEKVPLKPTKQKFPTYPDWIGMMVGAFPASAILTIKLPIGGLYLGALAFVGFYFGKNMAERFKEKKWVGVLLVIGAFIFFCGVIFLKDYFPSNALPVALEKQTSFGIQSEEEPNQVGLINGTSNLSAIEKEHSLGTFETKIFRSDNYEFSINYPSEWRPEVQMPTEKGRTIFKVALDKGANRKMIKVAVDKETGVSQDGLEQYYDEMLSSQVPFVEVLAKGKVSINGHLGVRLRFLHKTIMWAVEEDIFVLLKDNMFTITTRVAGKTREDALSRYAEYETLFASVVSTAEFK